MRQSLLPLAAAIAAVLGAALASAHDIYTLERNGSLLHGSGEFPHLDDIITDMRTRKSASPVP
jgi:hypothetical protein